RGRAILRRLSVEGATARDRAWALVGLGVNQLYQANIPGSAAYYRQAIETMPDLALAWDDLDSVEAILEHEEASLTAARGSVRLLGGSGPVDMSARARAILLSDDRG